MLIDLPGDIVDAIQEHLSCRVESAMRISGGCVHNTRRVETSSGRIFIKWSEDATPGMFRCEKDGLERLAVAKSLRLPNVLLVNDPIEEGTGTRFLALEWIDQSPPKNERQFGREFAHGLADLHRLTGATQFGLDHDNFLGSQPQPNGWSEDWAAFYRDKRLIPQIERAKRYGRMNTSRERRVMQVVDNLDALLSDFEPTPCLIHGDLWSGNFLCDGESAVLIDPAVYYAEREMEIAFIELFGGFPPNFVHDYNDVYQLDAGYSLRRPLHQLYPLLIHLNHFGETYGQAVDEAASACLSRIR
jgi:fructosamine-3-kinase